MSPAVVALARAFSTDRPDSKQTDEGPHDVATTESQLKSVDHRKSKSRSSGGKQSTGGHDSSLTQHSLPDHFSLQYHYDPYHQYCRTGSDYYKSYHLSYQAYCHAPKSKFIDTATGGSSSVDPRFYDRLATLRPPTKLANARARAVRLRRKISEFRERTSTWIQRLALITISLTIFSYIFTRSLISTRIGFNPLPFRRGFVDSKSLVGLDLISNGFCENRTLFELLGPHRENGQLCGQMETEPVFEKLFENSFQSPEDLPFIARHVFIKFYALGFLAILIAVSFVCERLFGRKLNIQNSDILEEEHEDISALDEDDLLDDDEVDEEEIDSYPVDDMYWDCQPTSIRVPWLPLGKLIVKPPQMTVGDLKISLLYCLPLRLISRIWGWVNAVELPLAVRTPLYTWYAKTFGCNLDEMLVEDLTQFRNLSEFFRRTLKPGVRPIGEATVVSPADGRVVQLEPVSLSSGFVGSVKGISYSVDKFLGPNATPDHLKPGHRLYSCVVYLAPGDYHRFHSPTDWTVKSRRHFSGRLFSVKPSFVAQVPDLFAINERVVYSGEWQYGFFSMTAVGATNVGTVNVFFDPELQTNQFAYSLNYSNDKPFSSGVSFCKGDLFGEFNLGSTIVLLYEAPEGVHFYTEIDKKIRYGENVCSLA